jgi:hypothetical protein
MTRARDNSVNPFNNNYAGKNVLINGAMDIWQRGTSFSTTGGGNVFYSADRWTCYSGNTGTISRDTSLVPTGFESSLKFTSSINNSGIDFYQLIETKNVIPLQGKIVTLSAYVAGTTGKTTPGMTAYYSTTNDDIIYLTSGVVIQTVAVPTGLSATSFQRISMTFTVPTTAKTIRIGLISGTLNNTEFINWSGVQLEVGSFVTPFSRAGGTLGGEIVLCQRYYEKSFPVDVSPANGLFYAGGLAEIMYSDLWALEGLTIPFKVPKRITPSINFFGATSGTVGGWQQWTSNAWVTWVSVTAPGRGQRISTNQFSVQIHNNGSSGFAVGTVKAIQGDWVASAEL